MNYIRLDELCENLYCDFLINEPMSRHTSFRVGGAADRFIYVNNKEQLKNILVCVHNEKIPYLILGNGSNLLITDKGIRGAVLMLGGEFKKIQLVDECTVNCGSGVSLTALSNFARDNSLSGLEFSFGIPGTVGGATYMNAGAYGGEMKDVLVSCSHIDENGSSGTFFEEELELSYRKSAYTDSKYVITDINLTLKKGDKEKINSKMNELMEKRKSKQPLQFASAGSTFKRPLGYFASALIEECGLKGALYGDAQVSTIHSGFIINRGSASYSDICTLIEHVKEEVYRQKNVRLECEIKIIDDYDK